MTDQERAIHGFYYAKLSELHEYYLNQNKIFFDKLRSSGKPLAEFDPLGQSLFVHEMFHKISELMSCTPHNVVENALTGQTLWRDHRVIELTKMRDAVIKKLFKDKADLIEALKEINRQELSSQRPGGGYSPAARISYEALAKHGGGR